MAIYQFTNESIGGILAGMPLGRDDTVLAICGSGDQAFAMAEFAKRVVAIDNNLEQIAYAMERAELLRAGNIGMFVHAIEDSEQEWHEAFEERYRYLHEHGTAIQKSIDRIQFIATDITTLHPRIGGLFTRFYLSNMPEHLVHGTTRRTQNLAAILRHAPRGAIAYCANTSAEQPSLFDGTGFRHDVATSQKAWRPGDWYPTVYRKE